MKAKPRARWWIVSTHVLTTGLAMPFVATAIGLFLVAVLGLRGMAALMLILGVQAIGYIGGTYYSLSYLKKKVISNDWARCTVPAIICFVAFAVLGLLLNGLQLLGSIPALLGVVVFYGVIIAAFAKITADGFRALQSQVQPPQVA